ncbi:hypothetical protein B0H34DRAFT_693600 [Crassisporium funariophilum]|nr:hypothetical protein B0H34DRAFT_693600 [Crassisporium funariophilum]
MVRPFRSRALLASLVWLQWVTLISALKGDSGCRRAVCLSARVEDDVVAYEMTGMLEPMGWMALGFGSRMVNTHSVIIWQNEDGSTTLSQRFASGYREPEPVNKPPRLATLSEPQESITRPPHSTTFSFKIPANHSLLASADPREELVFAYSTIRPDKSPSASLTRHKHAGYFTFDLTKEFTPPVFPTFDPNTPDRIKLNQGMNTNVLKKNEKVMIVHALLVSLGFLVLLPAGSLIGRWGRSFTPKWFKAHWMTNMMFALPVITLGVLLGPVIVFGKDSFRIHFANAHEVCGIILLFMYYAQVLLGRYIHARRNRLAKLGPITHPHPPLNILHIVLGVSIIGLAFAQVRSGLGWWETLTGRGPITPWANSLWKIWIVVSGIGRFRIQTLILYSSCQLHISLDMLYYPANSR